MTKPMDGRKEDQPRINSEEYYDPMSHQRALAINAVELYVLKSLPPDQERAFEEHYFECPECATAVAVEQALAEKTGSVLPKPVPWWHRLALPVLAPATAAMAGIAVYQHTEVSRLQAPQANTVIAAGESKAVHTDSVTIEFNLPEKTAPSYRVEIGSPGRETRILTLPAPEDGSLRESIQLRRSTLHPGPHELSVFTPAGKLVEKYNFTVR